jgi:hypothetical protein
MPATADKCGQVWTAEPHIVLDFSPNRVFIRTVTLISITRLKATAGQIVDRALKGTPQYIVRGDGVVMMVRADLLGVEHRPEGYFADAYGDPAQIERERKATANVKFRPER